jgi:hypothetical protein
MGVPPPADFKSSADVDTNRGETGTSTRISERLPTSSPLPIENDPELATVIDAWSRLPDAIRAGIMAIVRASGQ